MGYPVFYPVEGDVLPILFDSFDGGTGASITMTGLAVTDVEIYKDGGATQRASDAGYTLLDTDGIDFDGITGIHGFSIDLGDDTDAGFFTVGPWYHVVVSAITVDGQTVNFIAAAFRILDATRGMAGTALPAAAADAAGGLPISDAGGLDLDTQIGTDIDAILVDTGTTLDGKIDTIDTNVDAVLVDTGTTLDAALAVVDANVDAILVDTGTTLDAALAVVDANVDAILVDTGTTLQAELDGIQADTEDLQTKIGTPAGVSVSADIAAIEAQTDDIGAAGAGLTAVPWNAAWDAEVQSEAADALTAYDPPTAAELVSEIDAVQTDIAALNDLSAAQVNTEVVDALNVDTYAEPGQGAPAATASLAAKIGYLYKNWRNRKTQIADTWKLMNDDASTVDQKATVSDDGTTAEKGEVATGP
jgi:hypothetical protein